LKNQLSGEFEMKDLGTTKNILGKKIHKYKSIDKLYLSQIKYFEKVLKHFNMQDCKPESTPLASPFNLSLGL
jgi:hypothetical protein